MKMTLLEIVQEILSDIDSDEVNSINDTVESEQVALMVKSTYQAMMSNRDWPHLSRSIQVEGIGDTNRPTHMKVQDAIKSLDFFNYDKRKSGVSKKAYQEVKYLPTDQFLNKLNKEDSTSANVKVVDDFGGIELLIRTDKAPSYYTSFDDEHIICDSYDKAADSTLQGSKVQAKGVVMPSWTMADDHVPDLPDYAFSALVEEAKSRAAFNLKQVVNQKAEQEASRQQRWISRKSRRLAGGIRYPSYGRGRVSIPKE